MESTPVMIRFAGSVTTDAIYWTNPGPDALEVSAVYAVPDANVAAAADVVVVLSSGGTTITTVDVSAGLTAGTAVAQTVANAGADLVLEAGDSLKLDKTGAIAFEGGVCVQLAARRT